MSIQPPAPVRSLWRRLRTMRTAIILLLLLGAGASVGTFFPQRPIDEQAVDAWMRRNAGWADLAEALGLFDVYGSWWFMAIYGLLLVSLVGCLVPRYRAYARAVRSRPRTPAVISGQPQYRSGTVRVPPVVALDAAVAALRARRYRVARTADAVAGERGHLREGGSLIFHTAFFVLLIGVSIGKFFGFTGQVAVIEGEAFTETHIEYDVIEEGRYFNEAHRGFEVALDGFDVSWHTNGIPREFRAQLTINDDGRRVRDETIRVNAPLTHKGVRLYLLSWGWAPELEVRQRGRVLYSGPTVFLQREGGWRGVIKLPGAKPVQQGLDMVFFTDPELTDDGTPRDRSPNPVKPLVVLQQYEGDLGLDRPQSVYELDTARLVSGEVGAVFQGGRATLPGDIEVAFKGLRQYVVFQVASNPGAPVLLGASILLLVGLVPALYSSRRQLWVRAYAHEGDTRFEVAGRALQRKAAFEQEFAELLARLDDEIHRAMTTQQHVRIGASDG